LVEFPDLDKLLSGLTNIPKSLTANTVRTGIETLIAIKHTIKLAKSLATLLGTVTHNDIPSTDRESEKGSLEGLMQSSFLIFKEMMVNFTDPTLDKIDNSICEMFSENTAYSKSSKEMIYQECFAIKSGVHGLLDVARQSYLSTVEEIHKV
jgi:DNA mismatch repair protein MSH4